jgi:predicted SnoaL-like aldol condensation-catalyzing enzyme
MSKPLLLTCLCITALPLAQAAVVTIPDNVNSPEFMRQIDVGPITPYGETPAEAARKRLVFEWAYTMMMRGDVRGAFEKYVDKNFCDHGHLVTHGKRDCGTWEEAQQGFKRFASMAKPGAKVEVPTMATVDGEMVTMYGAGVDVFRVHDGKITDHWDGSPPAEVTLKAHPPGTAERVMRGEGPPAGGP